MDRKIATAFSFPSPVQEPVLRDEMPVSQSPMLAATPGDIDNPFNILKKTAARV